MHVKNKSYICVKALDSKENRLNEEPFFKQITRKYNVI